MFCARLLDLGRVDRRGRAPAASPDPRRSASRPLARSTSLSTSAICLKLSAMHLVVRLDLVGNLARELVEHAEASSRSPLPPPDIAWEIFAPSPANSAHLPPSARSSSTSSSRSSPRSSPPSCPRSSSPRRRSCRCPRRPRSSRRPHIPRRASASAARRSTISHSYVHVTALVVVAGSRPAGINPCRQFRAYALEQRDALDVRRVRKHVDGAAAVEPIPVLVAKHGEVGRERRRVARDVDDP